MPILKFKDTQTGQIIHLDWNLPHPPSERDIDIAARQQIASGEFPGADIAPRATLAAQTGQSGPRAGVMRGMPNSNMPSLATPQGRAGVGITDPETGGLSLMDYARAVRDSLTTPFREQMSPQARQLSDAGSERDFRQVADPEGGLGFSLTSRSLSPSSALQTATLGASGPAAVAAGGVFGGMGATDAADSTLSPARRIMGGLQAALGGWQVGKGAMDLAARPPAPPPAPTVDLEYLNPNLAGGRVLRNSQPQRGVAPLPPLDDAQQGLAGQEIARQLERRLNPMVKGADRRAIDSIDGGIKDATDQAAGQRAANVATDKAESTGRDRFVRDVSTELNKNLKPSLSAPKVALSDIDANIAEEAKLAAIRRAQSFRDAREQGVAEQKADLEKYRTDRATTDQATSDKDILNRYSDIRPDVPESEKLGPLAAAAAADAQAQNLARAQSQVRARAGRVAAAEPPQAPPPAGRHVLLPSQQTAIDEFDALQRRIHGEEPPSVPNGTGAPLAPPNLTHSSGQPSYPGRPTSVEPVQPATFDAGQVPAAAAAEPPQALPNLIRDTERPNFRVPPQDAAPPRPPTAPVTPESIADLARKVGAGGATPPGIDRTTQFEALPSTPPTDVTPDGVNWVEEYGKQLEDALRAAGHDPGAAAPEAPRVGEPVVASAPPAASSEPPTPRQGGMFTADDLKGSNDKLLGQVPGLQAKIAQLTPAEQAEVYKAFGGVTAAGRNAFDPATGQTGPINIDEAMATLQRLLGKGGSGGGGTTLSANPMFDPSLLKKAWMMPSARAAVGATAGFQTGDTRRNSYRNALLGAIAATAAAPRSAQGMENAIPWLTRASYEGMLAGPAQVSNLAGNIGSLAFAPALEAARGNTASAAQLAQAYVRPSTWRAGLAGLKEGWQSNAPLKLAEGVQPLGPAGRALGAVDRGTRNVLEAGGLSPDSAARYTFANNPVTAGMKHIQALQQLKAQLPGRGEVQIPTLSTLAPFIKTYLNQIETAAAHSPARLLSPALREAYPVTPRPSGASGPANWAEYTSMLPTPIAVAAGLGAAGSASPTTSALLGPLAAPFQAGAAFRDLKRTGRDSAADTARVVEQQVPLANEVQRFVEDPTRLPGQLAQRFMPSGLMAVGDKTLRDPRGSSPWDVGGYLMERMPWERGNLPIKPDFFGQPQQRSIIGGPPEDLYSRDPRAAALSARGLLKYSQSGTIGPDVQLSPEDRSRLQTLRGSEMIKMLTPFLQDQSKLANIPTTDPTLKMPPKVREAAAIARGLPPIRTQNDVYKQIQREGIDVGTTRFRAEKAREAGLVNPAISQADFQRSGQ